MAQSHGQGKYHSLRKNSPGSFEGTMLGPPVVPRNMILLYAGQKCKHSLEILL